MFLLRISVLIFVMVGSSAMAKPLADMVGTWQGSGWARETPQGHQESVRCRIRNKFDDASETLTLSGQCVVPGKRISISGKLTGSDGAERITGHWSNPDGIGSVRVVGIQRDGIVVFNFAATDPTTGRKLAQTVEWRVSDETLRLRSADRSNPSIMMSDISFRSSGK